MPEARKSQDEEAREALSALLARVRYKPHVQFCAEYQAAEESRPAGVRVHLKARVECSLHPGRELIAFNSAFIQGCPLSPSFEALLHEYLWDMVKQHEDHESEEWFQVDGKRVHLQGHLQKEPKTVDGCDCRPIRRTTP